jgi:flagellar motor switch protein FliN
MMTFLECWTDAARALFSQALAGEPELVESPAEDIGRSFGFIARFAGDWNGSFRIHLEGALLDAPLLGEGVDQRQAWGELLREVNQAAAGDLLARTGSTCRLDSFEPLADPSQDDEECAGGRQPVRCRAFHLKSSTRSWTILVHDGLQAAQSARPSAAPSAAPPADPGRDLLLDVELEATLRFGCRELPLGEVLDLGPGDVVQLDRTVRDPVDLVVGDKIVARGEVVLVNGNFGLRVTEVATPRRRLESIRCLF